MLEMQSTNNRSQIKKQGSSCGLRVKEMKLIQRLDSGGSGQYCEAWSCYQDSSVSATGREIFEKRGLSFVYNALKVTRPASLLDLKHLW